MSQLPNISNHAVERYIERVKPGLGPQQARREISALLAHCAEASSTAPSWKNLSSCKADTDIWFTVGADIAFPVRNSTVVTCLCRSFVAPSQRATQRKLALQERSRRQRTQQGARSRLNRLQRIERQAATDQMVTQAAY